MSEIEILTRLVLVLGFGAVLGLETETRISQEGVKVKSKDMQELLKERLGGVRTYTILSLFGAIGGILFERGFPIYSYLIFASIVVIVLAAYIMNIKKNAAFGMTTEIAILATVILGFAATADLIPLQIIVVVLIALAFILSQKRGAGLLVKSIDHKQLEDVIKFAIIAVVFLPFLPDQNVYLYQVPMLKESLGDIVFEGSRLGELILLNPFRIWIYVILISGFNLVGYFSNRIFGKDRGLLFAGIFGGFASSTSTTVALAIKSKGKQDYMGKNYAGIGLIANAASFVQIFVLAITANLVFAQSISVITFVMLITSAVFGGYFIFRTNKRLKSSPEIEYEPFSIGPALKFAAVLILVRLGVQLTEIIFGSNGFVVATALTGFVGMDVATITLGELVGLQVATIPLAVSTFLLANLVNFMAKIIYSKLEGSVSYFRVILMGMLFTAVTAIITAVFIVGS